MKSKKDTAEYIIEKVAPVFNKQGYVGASLSALEEAIQLTKGAIYGNFSSKEELAVRVFYFNIKRVTSPLNAQVKTGRDAVEKLTIIINYYRTYYDRIKDIGGCPVLNVGVDTKYINPRLFQEARSVSLKLIAGLARVLQEGVDSQLFDAKINVSLYARNIYSMIEGSVFMAITHDDPSYIDDILDHIEQVVFKQIIL
ncbi:MAG: TetR/AcrR family transcriptional regulator [Thermonemataceae bacterium]